MTNATPTAVRNLDQYGGPPLEWSTVAERFATQASSGEDVCTVLGTLTPDGRPHAAPVGALWIDGAWHVVTGPGTQKGRNLANDPHCTLTARYRGIDLVVTGEARRVTDPTELEHVAQVYRDQGWPAQVEGDAFTAPFTAPSGGPPPWHVFRIDADHAVGVGSTADTTGATRWAFD